MHTVNYIIRPEQKSDHRAVETMVRESFWNVYRPGCFEHYLLHVMRDAPDFVPELNFVMEADGRIIGQAVFARGKIDADDGREIPVLTLGPICIAPAYKRKGYGKILLDYAFEKAAAYGAGAVCFEGNIAFYGKCGCVPASAFGLRYQGLPEGADASFFLVRELLPGYLSGIRGEYGPSALYFVEEQDVESFDRDFPPKEKLRLPTQLF